MVPVLVASDEPVLRLGLIQLINGHERLLVCAEAESLASAWDLCELHRPAVVVVDPAMDGGGTGLLRELLKAIPQLRIVMYSSVEDALSVQRALAAGAHGYVTRRDPAVDVLTAILSALDGERHVGPRVRHVLLDELAHGAMKINGKPESVLSDRELQVFRLIGGGRKTCEIAEDLGVSAKTIETHRQRIKEKLHLHSGAELQQRAALSSNQKRQAKGSYRG